MNQLVLIALLLFGSVARAEPDLDAYEAVNKKDYATMLRIARPAAEKGEAWAQFLLGASYENGWGSPRFSAEAVKWYRLSAMQGNKWAQNNLGVMYEFGRGVLQDYAEALKWHRLSAKQGHTYGQEALGRMYYNGNGVPKSTIRAYMWFNLAASHDITAGGAELMRDALAKVMNQSEMAQAQKLARECQARNFKGCD